MIDIHAHILPGVDDGARDLQESLQMAKKMEAIGVKEVVATPHYFAHDFHLTPVEVKEQVKRLQQALDAENIHLKVLPGAEAYITPDLGKKVSRGQVPTLNNSRYILVEFALDRFPPYADDVLYDLQVLGLLPIISHPERYWFLTEKMEYMEGWLAEGILAQVNSGSLFGFYGKKVRDNARLLIRHNLVQLIGSDMHRGTRDKGDLLEGLKAIERLVGTRVDQFMENAQRVVADKDVLV